MRKSALAFLTLVLSFVLTAAQPRVPVDAETASKLSPTQQLDAEIFRVAKSDAPGVAVLVLKDGKTVYKSYRGIANLETRTPLSSRTPIYIASLGKQFTAVAVMMLADRGKLSYNDRLAKYFPELSGFAGDITIHHLLTHTSGLVDHLDIVKDNVSGWTNDDVIKLLKRENRVLFSPGEKVSYSNSGYTLLSMVVEKVSGQSFSEFLKANIFEPLKMRNTSVAAVNVRVPNRARGYSEAGGKWVLNDYEAFTTGGGGIYSTLEDMEKWDRSFFESPLIRPETLKLASTANKLNSGKPTAYGYGWLAEFASKGDMANVWYVASFGNFKGFKAMHKRIPERRFSVIIFSNSGEFPWSVMEKAQDLYAK